MDSGEGPEEVTVSRSRYRPGLWPTTLRSSCQSSHLSIRWLLFEVKIICGREAHPLPPPSHEVNARIAGPVRASCADRLGGKPRPYERLSVLDDSGLQCALEVPLFVEGRTFGGRWLCVKVLPMGFVMHEAVTQLDNQIGALEGVTVLGELRLADRCKRFLIFAPIPLRRSLFQIPTSAGSALGGIPATIASGPPGAGSATQSSTSLTCASMNAAAKNTAVTAGTDARG